MQTTSIDSEMWLGEFANKQRVGEAGSGRVTVGEPTVVQSLASFKEIAYRLRRFEPFVLLFKKRKLLVDPI